MDNSAQKVNIVSVSSNETTWQRACACTAELCSGDVWSLPFWIVPDGRHSRAAEVALLRETAFSALPTYRIHTLLSLAGEILGLPILDTVVRPETAELAIRQISLGKRTDAFESARNSPGFAQAFWQALEEAESSGHFPGETLPGAIGAPPPTDFRELHYLLKEYFDRFHRLTPGDVLRLARRKLLEGEPEIDLMLPLVIGPFFDLNPLELAFLKSLISATDSVHLVPAPGSEWITRLDLTDPLPETATSSTVRVNHLRPLTIETELDDTFAQIAEWACRGTYRYGDVRIIHPFIQDALPQLRSAARRYRVPLKITASQTLLEFPGTSQLGNLLDLFSGNWKRADILRILRSRTLAAPPGEISQVIAAILETGETTHTQSALQWIKLADTRQAPGVSKAMKLLRKLDEDAGRRLTGADFSAWIKRCLALMRGRFENGCESPYGKECEERGWTTLEALIDGFSAHFQRPVDRSVLIKILQGAVHACRYSTSDPRLDAVEVCPATREDHLPVPVLFYLSLTSRVPAPKRTSPFLKDELHPDYDEKFRLFTTLIGNGQQEIHLSSPKYDDEGNLLTRSPLLNSLKNRTGRDLTDSKLVSWKPFNITDQDAFRKCHQKTGSADSMLRSPSSAILLADRSLRWSVTHLNDALQCPYLYFARRILDVQPRPDQVAQGITLLIVGSVAHSALEEYVRAIREDQPFDMENWIRTEFQKRTRHFPAHPEADRELEELVRNLSDFVERGWGHLSDHYDPVDAEWEFGGSGPVPALRVDDDGRELSLEGRIDRIDGGAENSALIIDYKYSRGDSERKTEFFDGLENGTAPQLPLYALAVQELKNRKAAALLEIHLRSMSILGVKAGRIEDITGADEKGSEVRTLSEEEMDHLRDRALGKLKELSRVVAGGRLWPKPSNYRKCGPGKCDFADLCRYRKRWQKFL